jgi:predicted O-methyltransferase YrrM
LPRSCTSFLNEMQILLHRILRFLLYAANAKTKYYLHSPFVYHFYLDVLEESKKNNIKRIDILHRRLKQDKSIITFNDYGKDGFVVSKRIGAIAKHVSVSNKYGAMLNRLAANYRCVNILELGTSIGIGTAYLASASFDAKVSSIEGASALSAIAKRNAELLKLNNISFYEGTFESKLPLVLAEMKSVDLAYIDGHHTYEATLQHYKTILPYLHNNSIVVIDDINWSEGMTALWNELKLSPEVRLSIDLHRMGILFYRQEFLQKDDFVLLF